MINTDIAAQHALDRIKSDGFDALTEVEKTVAAAWLFEAGVGNSGFGGYYASHRGDLAFAAPAALNAIGAKRLATIAAEANAVFGPGGPPKEVEARKRELQALPASAVDTFEALEERFEAGEEDVDALLEEFLAHHTSASGLAR